MSYTISIQGHSEDEAGVREAFAYLVRSLRARGDVSGQLSDQSGGVNATDVSDVSDEEPDTDVPADEDFTPADDGTTDAVPTEDVTTTEPVVATEPVIYDANDPDNPANAGNG